jgi:hypothetical protein
MLVYLITSDTEGGKKPAFLIQYQIKLIFSYITLFTVQNYLNPSVYITLCVVEGNGEEVVFAGGGSKHEGGSYDMMPYSNVQYYETLKCS